MSDRTDDRIRSWRRNGWHPVRFAHHPLQIKDAIKRIGMRPQMKQCYRNCQRFKIYATWLEVEYHEGWVMSITPIPPIPHAWLVWGDRIIDLTLEPDINIQYLNSNIYTAEQIRANMEKTYLWCAIDERAFAEISPFTETIKNSL